MKKLINYLHLAIRFCLVFVSFLGCKNIEKEKETSLQSENKTEKWLGDIANFEKDAEVYKKTFWTYYDSLAAKKDFQEKGKALANYGSVLSFTFSTDSLFKQAALEYISKPDPKPDSNWIQLHFNVSRQFYISNEFEKSRFYAKVGISFCNGPQFDGYVAQLKKLAGQGFAEEAKPDSAIIYYVDALPFCERTQDYKMLGSLYYGIAYSYDKLHAYNESGKMYRKAIENFLKAKDTSSSFDLLATYGINQLQFTRDTASTLRLIDSSITLFNAYKGKKLADSSYANNILGYKFLYLKEYDSAQHYLEKSTKYLTILGNKYFLNQNEILNSEIFFKKYGQLKSPQKTKQWAVELMTNKQYSEAVTLYEQLYAFSKSKKDYAAADNYLQTVNLLNDSLRTSNQKGQLFELEKKYQSTQKEQALVLSKKEIENKRKSIVLLLAILSVVVLLGVLFIFWQKQKNEKKQKENTMQYTKQLLEKTEEDRKRIATDLHDSISHELMSLKTSVKEDFGLVNTKIDTIINDIRIISRNLHPVLFDTVGLQHTIEQLAERVQQQNNFMLTADIQYSNSLPSATELQVYRIVQEAVTNIIKYADAIAGKITIQETATHVSIEIKDNGKGFNVAETLSNSKAFGLHNIIERSRAVGGVAKIVSGSIGTIITINIQKNNS